MLINSTFSNISLKQSSRFVVFLLCLFSLPYLLAGCEKKDESNSISVGVIAGPEAKIMEIAQKIAMKKYNLDVKLVKFNDYMMPNLALNDGSIDANMFQHKPYLDTIIKQHGFKLVSIGKTYIYPMGIYSRRYSRLDQIRDGSSVAIPNDPTNGARALLLLDKAGLITLKSKDEGAAQQISNIQDNPHHLNFREIDAAFIARALTDVDLAIINTNYAITANLYPSKDAIFLESKSSKYANILAVKVSNQEGQKFKNLLLTLQSSEVEKAVQSLFKGAAIRAW